MPKVLLVTDASWVANQVSAALALGDWEIEVESDPSRAVQRVEGSDWDAVLVDMQVGTMGGMAVVRAIRQEVDPQQRPRLVLLLDRIADRFIAKRSGADAAVVKPIKATDLRAALASAPVSVPSREEE